MNEDNANGLELGQLPVNRDDSVENPDKEQEEGQEGSNGEGAPETSAEETKVSYSRFSNVNSRRKEAERRAWELEQEVEELRQKRESNVERSSEPPKEWFDLTGGDTPQARKAYEVLSKQFNPSSEQIERLASEAWQKAQYSEERRISTNEQTIDDELGDLSDSIGRDLTDDEQLGVLEIQDEYSVKDENNRILRLFPAEKAWEIYEMESGARRAPRNQNRDRVASLNSSRSEGEPAPSGRTKNTNFDPSWGAWEAQVSKLK